MRIILVVFYKFFLKIDKSKVKFGSLVVSLFFFFSSFLVCVEESCGSNQILYKPMKFSKGSMGGYFVNIDPQSMT